MLARREVRIGKCYVKENTHTAREIIARLYRQKVMYNAYDLRTGKLFRAPHQICSVKQLIRWADREATPDESVLLIRDEVEDIFINKQNVMRMDDPPIESSKSRLLTETRFLTPPS